MILASGSSQILLATGAGVFAVGVGGVGIWFSLGAEDRSKLALVFRHPVKTIFTEDEPDPDDF
ncbi:MAG TPA: hypothetical protein VI318_08780 [Baekduia sp.]